MHMFRTYTNASLAKMNAEKTSAEGYIMNYYENTIADNIRNLTTYPTDDEIHLIIHEAHEQAIAFAKVLEFIDEIDKTDCESSEISKAAELVNICNNFNLEKINDLEQKSQIEINFIYDQSDKRIIQENDEIFQMGVLLSEELDISYLISQRRKHEAYSSQRMERIYLMRDSTLNINKINNVVALVQNDGANSGTLRVKRWQNRKRLETLERYQNALVCVYTEQIPNIFGCFPADELKYVLFSYIPSHLIIYYLGNCENFTENMGFLIVGKKEMTIYNFFNSVIDKLQLIISTKSIDDNAV
ncbi:unnamed protein product [Rhizophagus irregularis]|nr:unnamed protein product [Rhizophagus irregularis]